MSKRFHPRRARTLLRGLAATALLALLVWPAASPAQEMKLRPYNNGRGMHSPVRTPEERDATSKAVRLSGTFRHNLRDGLTLDDRPVVVSSRTAVFPSIRDQSYLPDPDDLQGRGATVYGKQGPNGVEAVLVILDGSGLYGVDISTPRTSQMSIGEDADEPLEMPSGTPQ